MSTLRVVAVFLLVPTLADAAVKQVPAGADLQAVLNAAVAGDELVLEDGAVFTGAFRLPTTAHTAPVILRGNATLRSGSVMPALTGAGAKNWILRGLSFEATTNGQDNVLVFQNAEDIELDSLQFAAPETGQRRFVILNGRRMKMHHSRITGVWAQTLQDSQCILIYDGAGPYTITHNYLECASENIMVGGADSSAPETIPADILIEGNTLTKNPAWRGQQRAVKTLIEFKSGKRFVVRRNVLERCWPDAQAGWAVTITPRNQGGKAPWTVVEDGLFEQNIIRDAEGGFNILGHDDENPSGQATRMTLRHNLVQVRGVFMQLGGEAGPVTVDHQTVDQGWNFITLYKGGIWPNTGAKRPATFATTVLTVTNSLGQHNAYGVIGEDAGIGTPSLQALTKSYVWARNALAGSYTYPYPPDHTRPSVLEHQRQFDIYGGNFVLAPASLYKKAGLDGADMGWAPAALLTASPSQPTGTRIVSATVGGNDTMKPENVGGQPKGPSGASGQQKSHTATRVNPDTGQIESQEFTQEQWRQRDKAAGWTRPDGDADDADSDQTGS